MAAAVEGKGLWVWYASQIVGVYGTVEKAVDAAVKAGFSHILVKVANGWYPWLPGTYEGRYLLDLMKEAHRRGMKVHAWRYTFAFNSVSREIDACRRAWEAYGDLCSSWTEDAEAEYKVSTGAAHADALLPEVKKIVAPVPLGFTSYRYPDLHNSFPWEAFARHCDFTIPQVYWIQAHNPGAQIDESLRQYQARSYLKKFTPFPVAGSTYQAGTWKPTTSDLNEFSDRAQERGIPAINWWRWDTLVNLGLWETAAAQEWPVAGAPVPVPVPVPVTKHWSELTAAQKDSVVLRTAQQAGVADEDGFVVV